MRESLKNLNEEIVKLKNFLLHLEMASMFYCDGSRRVNQQLQHHGQVQMGEKMLHKINVK